MDKASYGATGMFILSLCVCNISHATATGQSGVDDHLKGHWIVDPLQAGESLPEVGRSLFDFLFTEKQNGELVYRIPFPYSELIKKLEQQVQPDHSQPSPVKQVLIPLGRSLARNIARPDFFLYPRVVSMVDTDPMVRNNDAGMMLKDRLYIGYGEAAQILEIISYNEAAGRFEFQIVTDYKPGGSPRVFYANREVCRACHQNAALIFSRPQWDETNANPRIAALLSEHKTKFYGIPVNKGVDIPSAIDAATDRANLFSLYQLLWQQGCEPVADKSENHRDMAIQCRRDLLTYVLQYLLSNRSVYDNQTQYYQKSFLPALHNSWQQHWPEGLLVSDPNIPNRDPLLITADTATVAKVTGNYSEKASNTLNTMLAKNDVSEKFEPLNYRAPLEHWTSDLPGLDKLLITGLASFIPSTDIQHLDNYLTSQPATSLTTINLSCTTDEVVISAGKQRVRFNCESADPKRPQQIQIKGRFFKTGNNWQEGKVSRLIVNGQPQFDLVLKSVQLSTRGSQAGAELKIYTSGNYEQKDKLLTARLPNGNSIEQFKLTWTRTLDNLTSSAKITVRSDFSRVTKAIDALVTQTNEDKTDALANRPFRRAAIMKSVLDNLGAPLDNWCCAENTGLPAAKLQDPNNEVVIVSQGANPEIAPFYHYCSACHRTSNRQPPNFLQGDEQQVAQNISQCAERIFFRLSMWHRATDDRSKSPMPPQTALHRLGFTQARWATSDELLSLKHAAANLISRKTGNMPDIEQLIKTGFSNLPECLPGG